MAVLEVDQRAGRPHAGVRLERPFVLGLDHLRGGLERRIDVADVFADFALAGRRFADVIVQSRLIGERRACIRPFDLERARRLDGVPLAVGDDAEEALVPDDLRARDILDRAFVDFYRHRARDRRPDHAAMHHAGDFDVHGEVGLREHLAGDVVARNRLADDGVVLRVLRLGFARRIERVAVFAVPVEMHVEKLAADKIGVARLFACIAGGADDTVLHRELAGRNAEFLGRHVDQHAARLGGGHAHLLAALLDAGRAGGAALIEAGIGVADENLHAGVRNVEFLGDHLLDGDRKPLAHVHLAEIGRDGAVGVDGDVGRQLVGHQRRFGSDRGSAVGRMRGVKRHRRADRDDQGAAGFQQRAAREIFGLFVLGHGSLLSPSSRRRA